MALAEIEPQPPVTAETVLLDFALPVHMQMNLVPFHQGIRAAVSNGGNERFITALEISEPDDLAGSFLILEEVGFGPSRDTSSPSGHSLRQIDRFVLELGADRRLVSFVHDEQERDDFGSIAELIVEHKNSQAAGFLAETLRKARGSTTEPPDIGRASALLSKFVGLKQA